MEVSKRSKDSYITQNVIGAMTKVLIVTDAWEPQINGVVTTLSNTRDNLIARGYSVTIMHPGNFKNFPMPGYSEIRLAWPDIRVIRKILSEDSPDHIHIATEGPIGVAVRKELLRQRKAWSSSFHTKFAEYIESRIGFGAGLVWRWLRSTYQYDRTILVTTESMLEELVRRGFDRTRLRVWSRGVDESTFAFKSNKPADTVWLNVGRVSPEKNLEEFYKLDLPGRKIQVGDGPSLKKFKAKYPDVEFVGSKSGLSLAEYYQNASVFVFPSKSDTFGLVMIEAMRCGTPVAAHPVTGPIDVVVEGLNGCLDDNLAAACLRSLALSRDSTYEHSSKFTWESATDKFLDSLVSVS